MLGHGKGRGHGGQRRMTAQNKLSQRVHSLEIQHRSMKLYNKDPTLGGEPWFITIIDIMLNIPRTFKKVQVMCSSCVQFSNSILIG